MFENNGLYRLAKHYIPQPLRNRMRASVRIGIDLYAGVRGLNPNGPLPDFLMVGAQKAGTTSLFNWLVESGVAQSPLVKEIGYFDARWHRPIKYRGYFKQSGSGKLVGEATPSYFAFPEVPERVVSTLGSNCKIVIVLRDPVDRAVSHYFHERRLGFEHRDMYTAITEEEQLIRQALDPQTAPSRRQYILTHYSYVFRSQYSERLIPWFQHFDRENILILNSEAMFNNPQETIKTAAEFLQAEIKHTTQFNPKNKNTYVFEDARVSAFLEERLSEETKLFKQWIY